jgi:hypothetical protein
MEINKTSRGSDFRVLGNCPEGVEFSSQDADQLASGGVPVILPDVSCLLGVATAKKGLDGQIRCVGRCEIKERRSA